MNKIHKRPKSSEEHVGEPLTYTVRSHFRTHSTDHSSPFNCPALDLTGSLDTYTLPCQLCGSKASGIGWEDSIKVNPGRVNTVLHPLSRMPSNQRSNERVETGSAFYEIVVLPTFAPRLARPYPPIMNPADAPPANIPPPDALPPDAPLRVENARDDSDIEEIVPPVHARTQGRSHPFPFHVAFITHSCVRRTGPPAHAPAVPHGQLAPGDAAVARLNAEGTSLSCLCIVGFQNLT